MSNDNRFDSYLSARAAGLDLPTANLGSVLDRVAQRRRHRRAAVSACTAIAVLGGALSVVNMGSSSAPEHVVARAGGGTLVASSLEWTSVTPRSGLSWSSATIVGPDKALYGLSTAPGSVGDDGSAPVLYRSTDGVEWTPTTLPDGLHPSSIASAGQSIYAVGTAPAGGNANVVQLASSTTAGGTWSKVDVPLDLDSLERKYSVKLGVSKLSVAGNGTQTVVAVAISAQDDVVDRLVPGGVAQGQGYTVDDAGLTVYVAPDKADVGAQKREIKAPEVKATYTWDELGVDTTLRSLILGETRMYVSDNGGPFTSGMVLNVRSSGPLYSTTNGFRMVTSSSGATDSSTVLTSIDGRTWEADRLATTPGWVVGSGVRRDMVALVTSAQSPADDQAGTIRMQQPGGTWTEIGLTDLLHRAGAAGDYYLSSAGVGPLGVAAVLIENHDGAS
jgi:hypothetical protein